MAPRKNKRKTGKGVKKGKAKIADEDKSRSAARPTTGLLDLPVELIDRIARYSEKRYSLMLTCKHVCVVVGKVLYAEELPYTHIGLQGVLLGLEHDQVSPSAPFGRDLKLEFLASTRTVLFNMYRPPSNGEEVRGWSKRYESNNHLIRLFNNLHSLDVILFDNVDLIISSSRWIYMSTLQALALVICPRRIRSCPWDDYEDYDGDDDPSTSLIFSRSSITWIPEIVEHRSIGLHGGKNHHPLVCHGSLHRICFSCRHGWFTSKQDFSNITDIIKTIIEFAHPEVAREEDQGDVNDLQREEKQLRDATRWEFGFDRCVGGEKWLKSGIAAHIQNELNEEYPELVGRITFLDTLMPPN